MLTSCAFDGDRLIAAAMSRSPGVKKLKENKSAATSHSRLWGVGRAPIPM